MTEQEDSGLHELSFELGRKDEETILVQTLGMIGVSVGAGVLSGVFPPVAPIALPLLGA